MTFQLHDAAPAAPITGRVGDKYLTDEMGESLTVVVDGIDPARVADATSRPSDRTIATIAEDGVYRLSRHLEQAKFEGRVPGGDYEGYVDAQVRRPEALRRAGIAERIDVDQWRIPEDFESRAANYDAGRNRQANIRILSASRLEQQIGADGATWLDRRLVSAEPSDLAPSGFSQQFATRWTGAANIISTGASRPPAQRQRRPSAQSPRHAARARGCPRWRRAGRDQEPAVPCCRRWRDRLRQVHRDCPAIERQVRRCRAEPRVHPCPVAAGDRPPAWPRGQRRRSGRIGVVATRAAEGNQSVDAIRQFSH